MHSILEWCRRFRVQRSRLIIKASREPLRLVPLHMPSAAQVEEGWRPRSASRLNRRAASHDEAH